VAPSFRSHRALDGVYTPLTITNAALGRFPETVLTYSDVAATQAGIRSNIALSLVAIANGVSFFGRLSSGWLAGRIGPMNVLIPFTLIAGVVSWAWPYATLHGEGGLIVVIVIYGWASGAFVGLIGTPLGHRAFGGQGDIGRRIGMIFTMCAIGALCGTPISGAVHSDTGGYTTVGWYAGAYDLVFSLCLDLGWG
jgi:predicted MFS family arabinose efflux permease